MQRQTVEGAEIVTARGTVNEVSDDGLVSVEYPGGRRATIRVPLEQVPSYRLLLGRDWRRLPPLASQP